MATDMAPQGEGSEVQVLLVIVVPAILLLAVALVYPLKPPKHMMPTEAELTYISESATRPSAQVIPFPAGHRKVPSLAPVSLPRGALLALPRVRETTGSEDSEKIKAGLSG